PLPPDILYLIISRHLNRDRSSLLPLSLTCRSLHLYCQPFLFQIVSIGSRDHGIRKAIMTPSEKFAKVIQERPEVLGYIQDLRILDGGKRMFEGSRPITKEERSLSFILTRKMKNLHRIELFLHVVWTLIPNSLQTAFCTALSLPSLKEVVFDTVRIPVDILGVLHENAVYLDFRGE
ncbi:hypothetical protein B0H34DRAFT_641044, partial [Crassisporium funariophilum]